MNLFKRKDAKTNFHALRNRLLGFLGLAAAAATTWRDDSPIQAVYDLQRPVDWPRKSRHRGHNTSALGQARRRKRHIREESKRRNWRTA